MYMITNTHTPTYLTCKYDQVCLLRWLKTIEFQLNMNIFIYIYMQSPWALIYVCMCVYLCMHACIYV